MNPLWLFWGLVGGAASTPPVIPPVIPLPDITGDIDYYRRYLLDTVPVDTFTTPVLVSTLPTIEDADYYRRYLLDTVPVDTGITVVETTITPSEDVPYLRRYLCDN